MGFDFGLIVRANPCSPLYGLLSSEYNKLQQNCTTKTVLVLPKLL